MVILKMLLTAVCLNIFCKKGLKTPKLLAGYFATVGGISQHKMPGFQVKFRLETPNTKYC